jgi:hypothetical protein
MRQDFILVFAIPSPALPGAGSVGMISACYYSSLRRIGTPLRKIIGSKIGQSEIGFKVYCLGEAVLK